MTDMPEYEFGNARSSATKRVAEMDLLGTGRTLWTPVNEKGPIPRNGADAARPLD
jgi:hypothetical protein